MLLVAVAIGSLLVAVLAVVQPTLPTRIPPVVVWVAVAAGAIAVGLADTAPTGVGPVDLIARAGFGALVPLAAARAGSIPTAWLLVISTVTLLVADAPGAPVAAVAAGGFLALMAAGAASPPAAALAAAAGLAPLAHAEWPVILGASAAAVAVATVPVLLVGLARTGSPARGRITLAAFALVVLLGFGAVAGGVAALSARTDIDRAVDLATDGIDRLGDDDDRARANLLDAATAFEAAEDTLTSWWARSALLVPVVAQQSRAVTTMASAGADLARTAADATDEADVDSVRPVDGVVDLAAFVRLVEPLNRSVASLQRADKRLAEVRSPLLLTPIAERLDTLQREIDGALSSAQLASQAIEVAPQMLGLEGTRRYFVAFQNSAESTANGGFLGNWAEITAENGRLTLTRSGRNRELTDGGPDPEARRIEGEPEFVSIYGQSAARYWGNINFTPDHPTVSRIIAQLYPQSGGTELDGVIAITPMAMSAFLELTGPIEVPGYPERLTPDNVARILLHDQYVEFGQEAGEDREDFLSDTVEVVFDELTSGQLPGPRVLATELGPAVDARHLQMWSRHDDEQALFARLGATGAAEPGAGDSVGITTQNLNGNKIDWFLHREVAYDVTWDPDTGEVEGTLTATIRNDAPSEGLPASVIGWGGDESLGQEPVADGENYLWFTAYTTLPIVGMSLDGEPIDHQVADEVGHHSTRAYFRVTSHSERVVTIDVRGVVERSSRYVVRSLRQPTVNPDEIELRVRLADGWSPRAVDGGDAVLVEKVALTRGDATEPNILVVDVEPAEEALTWLDRLRGAR